MIHIWVKRDPTGKFQRIQIEGHADYAEYGKDIVCAAVSGITIGMINAIEKLLDVQLITDSVDAGKLDFQIPTISTSEVEAKVQLLLEAMIVALSNVADEYPQFVNMSEQKG